MIQPKDEAIRDAKISGIQRQVAECVQYAYTKGYETCFEQKKEIEDRAYQKGLEDGEKVGKIQANAIEYQKGYEEGQKAKVEVVHSTEVDDAYKRGLSDAWEIMRKIHAMDMVVRKETFGYFNPSYLIKEYSVQDAINILREEEEKKANDEIKVGDEVTAPCGTKVVVTFVDTYDFVHLLGLDGMTDYVSKHDVTKTGRHFDIDKIFEQMRENIS